MSDPTQEGTGPQGSRWVWLFLGCIGFGVLMGWRGELQFAWVRSLVAGFAACILGLCISQFRKQG
jgi:hypothetical protein